MITIKQHYDKYIISTGDGHPVKVSIKKGIEPVAEAVKHYYGQKHNESICAFCSDSDIKPL